MTSPSTLDKAKFLLSKDRIEECLEVLFQMISETEQENKQLKTELTVYSASLQRAKMAYRTGLINYPENSKERNVIISAIMENIHEIEAFNYQSKNDSSKLFIINKELLTEQLQELASNLENSIDDFAD